MRAHGIGEAVAVELVHSTKLEQMRMKNDDRLSAYRSVDRLKPGQNRN